MFGRGLSFLRSAMEADDSSSDSSDSHVEYQYETPEDQNIEGIFCLLNFVSLYRYLTILSRIGSHCSK